jgi:CubicO group peptidase (beta-lactamase class C family)
MIPTFTTRLAVAAAVALLAVPGALWAGEATRQSVHAALPGLDAYIEEQMGAGAAPGLAVAIVFDDEVVHLKGFGFREMGNPEPVDAGTVFQLASFSKPLASTVVAALVGDGTVTWDSRIADIDPEFRLFEAYPSQQVTIRDLFSHRSGLPGIAGNDLESLGYDRTTILRRLRLVAPSSSFRAGYSYSNFGLTQGAVAAAKAAGMNWEKASETKLYAPLGMTSTSSRHADFLARANRATLHVPFEGRWQALSERMPDAQAPAGGVSSNVRDLAQWMRLQLADGVFDGKQLIEPEALRETHRPVFPQGVHPIYDAPSSYALGWGVIYAEYGEMWSHAGAFSNGARSVVSLLPAERLGISVLANAFPTGLPEAVANTFFDLVFKGESSRDWAGDWNRMVDSMFGPLNDAQKALFATPPSPASPPLALAAYAGTYANEYFGEAVVVEEDGGLRVGLGPGGQKSLPLTHFDRDMFVYFPADETPDVPFGVSFAIGPDGNAAAVTFSDLEDVGFGTFPRVME